MPNQRTASTGRRPEHGETMGVYTVRMPRLFHLWLLEACRRMDSPKHANATDALRYFALRWYTKRDDLKLQIHPYTEEEGPAQRTNVRLTKAQHRIISEAGKPGPDGKPNLNAGIRGIVRAARANLL